MFALVAAGALLLAAAGAPKLLQARPTVPRAGLPRWLGPAAFRLAGAVEVVVAAVALGVGGRLAGLLIALTYAVLAATSARLTTVASGQDCGCFGRPSPVSHWHTGVNLAAAAVGVAALVRPAPSVAGQFAAAPGDTVVLLAGAAALAWLGYLTMTALPELLGLSTEIEATT